MGVCRRRTLRRLAPTFWAIEARRNAFFKAFLKPLGREGLRSGPHEANFGSFLGGGRRRLRLRLPDAAAAECALRRRTGRRYGRSHRFGGVRRQPWRRSGGSRDRRRDGRAARRGRDAATGLLRRARAAALLCPAAGLLRPTPGAAPGPGPMRPVGL